MTTKQELPDEVLSTMAIEWRRKALEGNLHARGMAHELETELRRRAGAPFTNYDTLDLRPLESGTALRRWWGFWQRADRALTLGLFYVLACEKLHDIREGIFDAAFRLRQMVQALYAHASALSDESSTPRGTRCSNI